MILACLGLGNLYGDVVRVNWRRRRRARRGYRHGFLRTTTGAIGACLGRGLGRCRPRGRLAGRLRQGPKGVCVDNFCVYLDQTGVPVVYSESKRLRSPDMLHRATLLPMALFYTPYSVLRRYSVICHYSLHSACRLHPLFPPDMCR